MLLELLCDAPNDYLKIRSRGKRWYSHKEHRVFETSLIRLFSSYSSKLLSRDGIIWIYYQSR